MLRFLALAIILASCGSAHASGGISCEIADDEVTMTLQGGVTRGMGAPLFAFAAKIEIQNKRVPADLKTTEFTREHVAQYWLDGREMKLLLYRERDEAAAHGYVEATIRTSAGAESAFDGDYELTIYVVGTSAEDTKIALTGEVSCSVE